MVAAMSPVNGAVMGLEVTVRALVRGSATDLWLHAHPSQIANGEWSS
jgi:hypothetical protein